MNLMLFPPSWYGEHPDYYRNDDPPECPRCDDQVEALVDGLCATCDDDLGSDGSQEPAHNNGGVS